MEKGYVPSLEEAKRYIYSIDFSKIIDKMVKHQNWLEKDALTVCEMYKNFLYLNKKYGNTHKLPPSEDIDEFWHMHILDTKKYRQDCEAIFGRYFDHYPYFGIDETSTYTDVEGAFETMQRLYAEEFNGASIYQVRTFYSKVSAFIRNKIKLKTNYFRREQGISSYIATSE